MTVESFLGGRVSLHAGDCLDQIKLIPDASIDSVVTDPPYALVSITKRFGKAGSAPVVVPEGKSGAYARASAGFMGKAWDVGDRAFAVEFWAEVYRVLKPGGHVLAFGGTRTVHRLTCAIEDAGFEIRDMAAWMYGCLDEQTEAATKDGVKPYHKIKAGDPVLCYDVKTGEYSYQPVLEVVEYDYADTAFRIVGDFGEQVVSRNHRCIIERGGREAFQLAEACEREARVPVLESLSELQQSLHDADERAGCSQQNVRFGMREGADRRSELGLMGFGGSCRANDHLRGLSDAGLEAECVAQEGHDSDVQFCLQRGSARRSLEGSRQQGAGDVASRLGGGAGDPDDRGQQSGMEGWPDVPQPEGGVCQSADQVCALSDDLRLNGAEGRVRDGTPLGGCEVDRSPSDPRRGGASHQSQRDGQCSGEPDAVCNERSAQGVRAWRGHRSAVVRVVPFHYVGKVWCLRVPTGAFVAVRNGVAFPTGNSGFPKSHDVSKGIDKRRDDRASVLAVTSTMADAADLWGITRADVDAQMGTSDMGGWWLSRLQHRCQCPRWDQWLKLKPLLNLNDELDAEVWRLNGRKGTPGQDWLEREVTGEVTEWNDRSNYALTSADGLRRDKASSAAARQWEGWGTALKPAMEPITMARKPLAGTVAENVLAHGTGALHIAACRVGDEERTAAFTSLAPCKGNRLGHADTAEARRGTQGAPKTYVGRWPANVILDGSSEVTSAFPEAPGQQRAVGPEHGAKTSVNVFGDYGARDHFGPRGDSGSAARFFYNAKADSDDRIGSKHPTVKPVDLMRYLVRLVTPPGGVVLDPFAGTGTTGEAAYREGFSAVLIEREDEYRADIARRMELVLAGPDQRRHAIIKAKGRPDDLTGTLFAMPEAAE